jgi:hypothetical protein
MKTLAAAGNVTVQSSDPTADAGQAQTLADIFSKMWPDDIAEDERIGVDIDGIEYVVVLAAVGIGLACTGAGEWSLDHAFGLHWSGVPKGLIIVLAAGIGGGLLQLATFWRPKSVASA